MARSTPQSFEKRQRERRKREKREEKFWRRLERNEEKRRAKDIAEGRPVKPRWWEVEDAEQAGEQ